MSKTKAQAITIRGYNGADNVRVDADGEARFAPAIQAAMDMEVLVSQMTRAWVLRRGAKR